MLSNITALISLVQSPSTQDTSPLCATGRQKTKTSHHVLFFLKSSSTHLTVEEDVTQLKRSHMCVRMVFSTASLPFFSSSSSLSSLCVCLPLHRFGENWPEETWPGEEKTLTALSLYYNNKAWEPPPIWRSSRLQPPPTGQPHTLQSQPPAKWSLSATSVEPLRLDGFTVWVNPNAVKAHSREKLLL